MDPSDTDLENDLTPEKVDDIDITPLLRPQQWDLRFTFSEQTSEHEYLVEPNLLNRYKHIAKALKDKIINYTYEGKLTGGVEVKNKIGEHTRCHVHFRFLSIHKKDTMVKPFKSLLKDKYDQDTVGNKVWYFKSLPEQDVNKFWRYPLKETLMPSLCSGYPLAKLEEMAKIANAHLQTTIQVNQKKLDNRDSSDTLFSRLKIILGKEKCNKKIPTVTRIIKFYSEEDRPLNKTVIVGYALTYLVQAGHLDPSELAQEWV